MSWLDQHGHFDSRGEGEPAASLHAACGMHAGNDGSWLCLRGGVRLIACAATGTNKSMVSCQSCPW